MNTMTTRDKWLSAALPALLTLLLGWLIGLRPAGREIAQLRQRVHNLGSLESRKALLAAAQATRADLEKTVAEKRSAPAGDRIAFDRNWAMQQVSVLCDTHGLSLEKSNADPAAQLSPVLRDALPALAGSGPPPQVWRLELSGSYPNVVKLLEGLRKAKPLIVPLNLSMQSGKTERHPTTWVLTLWL
jgi:hypothetical protein